MALPLMHTLSRNASRDQILAGKYGQIRIHVSLPLRFHAVRLSFLRLSLRFHAVRLSFLRLSPPFSAFLCVSTL